MFKIYIYKTINEPFMFPIYNPGTIYKIKGLSTSFRSFTVILVQLISSTKLILLNFFFTISIKNVRTKIIRVATRFFKIFSRFS